MDIIFEVRDKSNRSIHLSKERWSHIATEHKEMSSFLEEIKQTLVRPDKIIHSTVDETIKYYYKYIKIRKGPEKYLLVVVKYLNGSGFVVTTYFVRSIKLK